MTENEKLRADVKAVRADVDRLMALRADDEAAAEMAMLRMREIIGSPGSDRGADGPY